MINKQLLQKRFSEQAITYDQYANVQKRMARQCIHLLSKQKGDHNIEILEVGCGTGYFTQLLCETFPNARITSIDLAPGMIERAREKVKEKRVTFLCGDIEEMSLRGGYDLIVSNATFQWLNHLPKTIERLSELLNKNGIFLFSTFGNETFHELHTSYERAKQKLQLTTNSSPGQTFRSFEELKVICKQALASQNSYNIIGSQFLEIEYFPTVRAFFTSVKKVGENNSNKENYCQRPAFFREFLNQYEVNYRDEAGVKATYHCIFMYITKR
ncbi:malonyl-ACP O-methyltransferase BioC [Ectobacillus polymachus]|uniref:malonyl-ACP O-methyltransferase BioC n=1 Tax=Ectobacillus polymachus TaxID=1508806 RepID=UPI003A87CD67